MESEGPYAVKEENGVSNLYLHKLKLEGHTKMFLMDLKMLCEALNTAHCVGEKAERERCAKIAEKEVVLDIASLESGEFYSNSAGRIIAEKIRGGQDAK